MLPLLYKPNVICWALFYRQLTFFIAKVKFFKRRAKPIIAQPPAGKIYFAGYTVK